MRPFLDKLRENKIEALEVLMVLSIAVLPDIYNALCGLSRASTHMSYVSSYAGSSRASTSVLTRYTTFHNRHTALSFHLAAYLVLRSIRVIIPLLLVIRIRGESFEKYGFSRPKAAQFLKGLGRILLTYVLLALPIAIVATVLGLDPPQGAHPRPPTWFFSPNHNLRGLLVFVLPCILNSFAEELAMRCYLYTKLEFFLKSELARVLLTSLLFALYHVYQGTFGFLWTFAFGLALSSSFRREKNIYILVTAHAAMALMHSGRLALG